MLKEFCFSPSLNSSVFRTCANAERPTTTLNSQEGLSIKLGLGRNTLATRKEVRYMVRQEARKKPQAFFFFLKNMHN